MKHRKQKFPLWTLVITIIILVMMLSLKSGPPRSLPHLIDGKWGFIDKFGQVVIAPQFDQVSDFHDGKAVIKTDGVKQFIDKTGALADDQSTTQTRQPPSVKLPAPHNETHGIFFISPHGYCDELLRVCVYDKETKKRHYGYMNRSGQWEISPRFVASHDFSEGMAAVNVGGSHSPYGLEGGKWGYIDKTGKILIKPRFTHTKQFCEGVAPVDSAIILGPFRFWHRWQYINRKGERAIPGVYAECGCFSEGMAPVNVGGMYDVSEVVGGLWGYITKDGEMIIKPQFTAARRFSEGLAAVKSGGTWVYSGKITMPSDNRLWFGKPGRFFQVVLWIMMGLPLAGGIVAFFIMNRDVDEDYKVLLAIRILRAFYMCGWLMLLLSFVLVIFEQPLAISMLFLICGLLYTSLPQVWKKFVQKKHVSDEKA